MIRQRAPGWESRLAAALRDAVTRRYDVRAWNCATFAHACACAVSGHSLPYRHRGSLVESVDAILPRVGVRMALRGDVVLANVPEPSLGVCVGRRAAFVTVRGLVTYPMRVVRVAWSV